MCAPANEDKFPKVAPKQPARVEPKSYFANERTFIQWISAALLQVTVAVILLEYASHHPEYPLVSVGLLLCGAAGIVLTYALFNYHRRVKLLNTGSPYGYIDYMGPTFLALTIVVGIVVITVIVAQGPPSATLLPMEVVREEAGLCAQQSATGLSNLEYEPSDIVFDTQRGLMLVPSLSTIKAYKIASSASGILDVASDQPNIAAKTLVDVPGSNMEGLTYAGDRVFALSESVRNPTDPSELIELKWVSTAADSQGQGGDESNSTSDFKLELVQRWSIPTPQAEGIAFVPDSFGSSGKLYIAGDNGPNPTTGLNTDRGSIDVYDIPTTSQVQLQPSSSLSSKALNQGLSDSKIASLQYFEGLLYVLHDNVIGVRVWDLTKGEIRAEWRLPMVGGGFEKQWEGMWLQRHKVEAAVTRRGLRGSDGTALIDSESSITTDTESSSKLILHLALDTPAEVWSFAVEEGASPGQIRLPLCAAA